METSGYTLEQLQTAENRLKVLSHEVEDEDVKAIEIARKCIFDIMKGIDE